MGKKMRFPLLFKTQEEESTTAAAATSWQWPSCANSKTLSFRAPGGDIFKTINSAYDTTEEEEEDPDELLDSAAADPVEAVISGLRTAERLFFEPGETSSILGESSSKSNDVDGGQFCPEKEEEISSSTELVAMDSMDPYVDFKRSMEEMVEAHGLKEWEGLEELLGWYLKANGKEIHGYIVGAFVDMLVGLSLITTSSSSSSSSSEDDHRDGSFSVVASSTACSMNSPPLSFSSSITCSSSCSSTSTSTPCLSSLEAEDEIDKTVNSNRC
ncbi:hypothetical protein Vadar_000810 [Vaccinium darrowii]|uniref:Uncharacterized protein n=1 Tax=Vaccinium darrowii TaxID=229202 RepID=A0ACB7YIN9_9ERIC|nr:hypothetical protein Vadar_000810 [Vaccinium darrowii]